MRPEQATSAMAHYLPLSTFGNKNGTKIAKDWFYRSEERRWITLNDNSSWRRIEEEGGKIKKTVLHIA